MRNRSSLLLALWFFFPAALGNNTFLVEFWAIYTRAGKNIKVTGWSGSSLVTTFGGTSPI